MSDRLKSEMSRMMKRHGVDEVLAAATFAAEKIRREKLIEDDFEALKIFAEKEAWLRYVNEKPTAKTKIAAEFWTAYGGWSDESVKRRILRRLATSRWESLVDKYYLDTCRKNGTIVQYKNALIQLINNFEIYDHVLKQISILHLVDDWAQLYKIEKYETHIYFLLESEYRKDQLDAFHDRLGSDFTPGGS